MHRFLLFDGLPHHHTAGVKPHSFPAPDTTQMQCNAYHLLFTEVPNYVATLSVDFAHLRAGQQETMQGEAMIRDPQEFWYRDITMHSRDHCEGKGQ